MSLRRISLLSMCAICAIAGIVHAETRQVPADYATIQGAITASEDGDTVVVSPGVYFERISFQGKDITVTSIDPDDSRVVGYTVLNGEGEGSVVTFPGGETAQAVLSGFTITGGYGTYNSELSGGGTERLYMGGGIYCLRSSPTLTKNVIVRNEGTIDISPDYSSINISYGGGIGTYESNPTITHNTIRNNAAYVGGGIICFFGTPNIHDNVIFENSAYLAGGLVAFGGQIYNNTFVRNDCDYGATSDIPDLGTGMGGNMYMVFAPEFGVARVHNNILVEAPSGGGIFWEGDVSFADIAYNNVWGNIPDNYGYMDPDSFSTMYGGEGDQTGLKGNISADPLFQASLSKNFHLTLDSPCINAGDPDFFMRPGLTDIDGEGRVYAARIDMGADEYEGYVKPVASAGRNVHVLEVGEPVTLDGGESFFYDPDDIRTYRWSQVSGPEVVLDGLDAVQSTFSPPEGGEYIFQLVVGDSQYESEPDQVLVFVGPNRAPVADAGSDRVWQAPGQVSLDGTASSDPDPVDWLRYSWTQVEGPAVALENADTATPTFAAEPDGIYVFELRVNDGFEESPVSQVRVVTVRTTVEMSPLESGSTEDGFPRYPDISATKVVFALDNLSSYNWRIGYQDFRTGQTDTFSASGFNTQPKIDGDLVVWAGNVRFSNNVLSRECASIFAYDLATEADVLLRAKSDTESYSHPAVSGQRVVWVQHQNLNKNVTEQWSNMPYDICGADVSDWDNPVYFTVATEVGRRDPLPIDDIYGDYDDVVDIDGDIVVWEAGGDIYAADISDLDAIAVFVVCDHEGRQYDPAVSGRYVVWTDERDDGGDIYGADISDPENVRVFDIVRTPGEQRQPTIDGSMVAYLRGRALGGQVELACMTRSYGAMSIDTGGAVYGLSPLLDGTSLAWLSDTMYGFVQGRRVAFGYSIFDGPIENVTTGQRYDYIQHAISAAEPSDEIVVPQGVHREKLNFVGKAVTVRSADPTDPAVVAATILTSDGDAVTFAEEEMAESVLDGLTITGAYRGIFLSRASATIKRCNITANRRTGALLTDRSAPTFVQCRIEANGGAGIEAWIPSDRRTPRPSTTTAQNTIIAGNGGAGIDGGKLQLHNCTVAENLGVGISCITPVVSNSIIYFNDRAGGIQIDDDRATVTFSDIQGGWSGDGNLDVDPLFVALGQMTDAGWVAGDYHLVSQGRRWDSQAGSWTSDDVTSPCIDAGDPAAELADEPVTVADEPAVTNERINMGAYGGTSQASLAPAAN